LEARDLEGIWRDIRRVGTALDLPGSAGELILNLKHRLDMLEDKQVTRRPRILCIEWLDPLYLAGHWVPEQIEAAGGVDVGAPAGSHSVLRQWDELPQLRPDNVVVMLCGFGLQRARQELERLDQSEALDFLDQVPTWIMDGNQYTSRPGPRVVTGAEQMRAILTGQESPEVERWGPTVDQLHDA
jgi:iron complex transport system substrate-binding protein